MSLLPSTTRQPEMPGGTAAQGKVLDRLTLVALILIVGAGAWLRLSGLADRSISHPEMWAPGIRMPEFSDPPQRLTLQVVLTETYARDSHPPGYYLLMLAWTKCFGADLRSIRLPSAILGIASIALVFWLGMLTGHKTAGLTAAALVAVNGHHIFWSQIARMHSLACFLGLAATILLLYLARGSGPRRTLAVCYAAVLLMGLASHIFFWTLLATHILWTLLNAWDERRLFPAPANPQIFALILGSQLLAFAGYQSGAVIAPLSADLLGHLREYVEFGFLFPMARLARTHWPLWESVPAHPGLPWLRGMVLIVAVILLIIALRSKDNRPERLFPDSRETWSKLWIAAAVLATAAIAAFVFLAEMYPGGHVTLSRTKVMTGAPLVLLCLAVLLRKLWGRLIGRRARWRIPRLLAGSGGLVRMLAIVPFATLAALSLVRPVLNQRGMLLLVPYLLLLLAAGIVWAGCRARWRWALLLLVPVALLHGLSLGAFRHLTVDPLDFAAFVQKLQPRIQKTDLIFLRGTYYSTPILYYLTPERYRLVGTKYEDARRRNPTARVWMLIFYTEKIPETMQAAVADDIAVETIAVRHARATLYETRDR